MNFEYCLSEVRRISAGGDPRRVRLTNVFQVNASRFNWKANDAVLRLLAKVDEKACANGTEHQGDAK